MSAPLVFDNTLGVAFIGLVFAALLNGGSMIQAWYYFTYQSDTWPLQFLVGAVMAFDTIHQALITQTVYMYIITNWGNPAGLQAIVWSNVKVEVIFNGLIALLVQSFLGMRVWRLSNRNKILTSIIVLLVLGQFVAIIMTTAVSPQTETYAQAVKLGALPILVNTLAAAGDVVIAASLCILFCRSRTGRFETKIDKFMLFALNTGLLTSLIAVGSLIVLVVARDTFIYLAFFFCIGRLYTNSLLATLNSRKAIFTGSTAVRSVSYDLAPPSRIEFSKSISMEARRPTNSSKTNDTTTEFTEEDR